jgi:hypothetical protein
MEREGIVTPADGARPCEVRMRPICPVISDRSLPGWLWRLGRCARQSVSRYNVVLLHAHFIARESEAHRLDGVRALEDSLRG